MTSIHHLHENVLCFLATSASHPRRAGLRFPQRNFPGRKAELPNQKTKPQTQ